MDENKEKMDENKEKDELNDEQVEQVSGGNVFTDPPKFIPEARPKKPSGDVTGDG